MIDLETVGLRPSTAVLQFAIMGFDPVDHTYGPAMVRYPSLEESVALILEAMQRLEA
jgi:hypothetical protein